jgi:pilus assembly protein CpaE
LISQFSAKAPDTVIICASRNTSPDLILRSLRAGAREFLRLPIIGEEFKTVMDRTSELCGHHIKIQRKRGRAIAVFSSKGGCGISFIATNMACALGHSTALVDLNLQTGDLDLFLGVEPKFSIADLVENRARLDDALLASYMTPYSSHLALLAAPREAGAAEDIRPEHIIDVLHLLRERFDNIVIDTQHSFDGITLAALDQADDIMLVLPLDIPSIRNAQRTLAIFDRLGYPRNKVRVIVNRWSKQVELELQQVERFLGERVEGLIPSDYRAAVNSINLGQPLVKADPNCGISTEIRRIAAHAFGTPEGRLEAEPRRRLLKSLFRRSTVADPINLRETLDKA